MSRGFKLGVVLASVLVLSGLAAVHAAPTKLATPNAGPAGIEWRPVSAEMGLVLTVSGPAGFYLRQEFAAGERPAFSVFDAAGGLRPAGSYVYELRAVPRIDAATRAELQAARERGAGGEASVKAGKLPADGVQSGSFAIADGTTLMGGDEEPGAGKPAGPGGNRIAPKDQVIPDDLIVQGSICAGFDCVNNENFGFDTIRLKENNTRIQFDDTSSTTGFPTNNWQIRANSSASGGTSFLGFVDQGASGTSETGTIVFAVEAGAVANSLYVDTGTRIGIGTSTPVLNLHVNTSNTPALRLEQNNSGGFTAQTWDVAGNEANFFVRSVTTGSQLPFRIRPGAPSSSIDIANDGDVGIGTASPSNSLHVSRSDGTAKLLVSETNGTASARELAEFQNNGNAVLILEDTSVPERWTYTGGSNYLVNNQANPGVEYTFGPTGNFSAAGTITPGSSRSIKHGFSSVDAREVLGKVIELPITSWSYNGDGDMRHIGPMSEDFFAAFQVGGDKGISVTDSAGVALAAVQGLHMELEARNQEISSLREQFGEELAALKAELAELRAQQQD